MIKFGIILIVLVCWVFATMTVVNNKGQSRAAFIVKSLFFWVAIIIAYTMGEIHLI